MFSRMQEFLVGLGPRTKSRKTLLYTVECSLVRSSALSWKCVLLIGSGVVKLLPLR